ncbi:hypothetical protein BABINDRAFT_165792 [Babjeviella inositovora NRRL Y-12698]|uniref:DNA replication regulator SLD2 n=1 Tax=Babjeviella inositovora NRRL Y-12698 TaxID=984486 RepID=A0A1E3QU39_9ASCO|nr:uncharacterized protein BABINDRAFT_165792 [Babjeviella inositovora NRRL Y-12698]ODQ81074.1 hypothetical protein BABINDRAFT_165792 [Babjeviella inositovora NRRL Y-12698]
MLESLKLEIKTWEHAFSTQNGRPPQKEDIKRDAAIAQKYKHYRTLKLSSTKPKTSETTNTPALPAVTYDATTVSHNVTPIRSRYISPSVFQTQTPIKTSPTSGLYDSPLGPFLFKELGPTPQLDGRVMGLFEIITTPGSTPEKPAPAPSVPVEATQREFTTPSKRPRRLSFGSCSTPTRKHLNFDPSEDMPSPRKLTSSPKRANPRTPQHQMAAASAETPSAYFRASRSHIAPTKTPVRAPGALSLTSPSPFGPSRNVRKSLSTMFNEIQSFLTTKEDEEVIQELHLQRQIEAEEAEMERMIAEDQERNKEVARNYKGGKPWKKKGQKRTTRKVRINVDPRMVAERMKKSQ